MSETSKQEYGFDSKRQGDYYRVLAACDKAGSSTAFVEFATTVVEEALKRFLGNIKVEPSTPSQRIEIAAGHFSGREFSRKDYAAIFPRLSTATASRDLRHGVDSGRLQRSGEKALSRYRFA